MPTTTASRKTTSKARKPSSRTTAAPRKAPASRAKKTQGARKPQAERAVLRGKSRSGNLPGWDALGGRGAKGASARGKKTRASRRVRALDATPSLKLGVLVVLACALVTAFVGHTFATQTTLADVQEARAENQRLRLTHQRLRGAFDGMTGPEAVMPEAARLGLEEGVAYGPAITLD